MDGTATAITNALVTHPIQAAILSVLTTIMIILIVILYLICGGTL